MDREADMYTLLKISDLFFVHQRGTANGVYFVAVMVGSFLTPMAGGAQAAAQGWRWSYYALSIALTLVVGIFAFAFEETKYIPLASSTTVQAAEVAAADNETKNEVDNSRASGDKDADTKDLDIKMSQSNTLGEVTPPLNTYKQRMRLVTPTNESLLRVAVAPVKVIFFPHVIFTGLQFASGVCWLVMMLIMTSILFSAPPYNFDTTGVGLMALGPFIGNIFGALYGGPFSDWSIKFFAKRNGGTFEPEMRLYTLLPPAIFMSGGLAMFGVTAGMVSTLPPRPHLSLKY